MEDKQHTLSLAMRFMGRAVAFTAAVFTMILLIGGALIQTGSVAAAGILLAVIGVVALAGCILSFWRERLAILLLALVAAGLAIHIGIYAGRNQFITWLVLGLPYLAADALLLAARWLEGRE